MEIFMAFAMNAEGGGRVSCAISVFFQKCFLKNIPWLQQRVLHIVWALYYIHIVVEVTVIMAEY